MSQTESGITRTTTLSEDFGSYFLRTDLSFEPPVAIGNRHYRSVRVSTGIYPMDPPTADTLAVPAEGPIRAFSLTKHDPADSMKVHADTVESLVATYRLRHGSPLETATH